MARVFDDAVVGAGIIGLAVARELARRGRRVVVLERHARAEGASVRNFGTLWPIGQPPGPAREVATRSMELWRELLPEAGLWHSPLGSLHLAYHDDEERVVREFAADHPETCQVLDPSDVHALAPVVQTRGLLSGLFSRSEICVDSRAVLATLPRFLADRYPIEFAFDHCAVGYDAPTLHAGGRDWRAGHLWVCSGDEFRVLFPEAFANLGVARCKLQMMRSAPLDPGVKLGPILAGGLTMRHYRAFEGCPSLPALRARVAAERPEFDRLGIHVMVCQSPDGSLVIGDSHEYGDAADPFDKPEIDAMILEYLTTFLDLPGLRIASRWHGTYARHPHEPFLCFDPAPGATAVMAVNGTGMTLSLGLAERAVNARHGEA